MRYLGGLTQRTYPSCLPFCPSLNDLKSLRRTTMRLLRSSSLEQKFGATLMSLPRQQNSSILSLVGACFIFCLCSAAAWAQKPYVPFEFEPQERERKEECYIYGTFCMDIPEKRTDYIKNQLLLLLNENISDKLYQSILDEYGLTELNASELASLGLKVKVADTRGKDTLELIDKINLRFEALQAATNNVYKFAMADSRLPASTLPDNAYPKLLTGADQALQYSRGKGVLIGMIDGPVDVRHSTFKGRVVQHSLVKFNSESVATLLHGTAVAGILMSSHRLVGIAPSAKLYSIAAFNSAGDKSFSSSSALIAEAIDLAIKRKVDILNLSFAGGADGLVEKMIKKALSAGIIVVASCGNDASSQPRYPAAIPGVIAVTAVDYLKRPYVRANRGEYIDLAAPGVEVLTTGPGNRYRLSTGTSLAAANASGSLALLLAKKKNIDQNVLSFTASDLGQPGRDFLFGDGLINIFSALQSIQ